MSDLSALALPHVAELQAYVPGLQPTEPGWTKLNTNESPYPPSPRVREALLREIGDDGASLRLYPNPTSAPLRRAVAEQHGVTEAQVCIGNGSDDLLNLLVRIFGGPQHPVGFTLPSYSLYPVLVAIQDGRATVIEFDRSLRLPVGEIAAAGAGIFFLTSPNAPTGVGFPNADLRVLLQAHRGVVVVDEAYAPFARESAAALLAEFPRLVVVRTLSKAFALAGIRVGYALADAALIALLDRVRDSYNVNRLSQVAALAALGDPGYYAGLVRKICATRDDHVGRFRSDRGWFTYESQANFIFTEPRNAAGESGAAVARSAYDFLGAHRVLVRYFPSHALTRSFLRITVGTDEQMLVLQQTLEAWLKTTLASPR